MHALVRSLHPQTPIETADIPKTLIENWQILDKTEQETAAILIHCRQFHIFSKWPKPGSYFIT